MLDDAFHCFFSSGQKTRSLTQVLGHSSYKVDHKPLDQVKFDFTIIHHWCHVGDIYKQGCWENDAPVISDHNNAFVVSLVEVVGRFCSEK